MVADANINLLKTSVSHVTMPEYDFWEPSAYQALFGLGEIVEFEHRGQKLQGIWKRATHACLPEGVLCRSQDVDMSGLQSVMKATASNGDARLAMQALADLSTSTMPQLPEAAPSLHMQGISKPTALRDQSNMLPLMDQEQSESGTSASSTYWPLSIGNNVNDMIADLALEISAMCRRSQIPKFKMVSALNAKVSKEITKLDKKDAPQAERDALTEMTNTLDTLERFVDIEVRLNSRMPR